MNNTELKLLVRFYHQTRKRLDELREDYQECNIHRKIVMEVGEKVKQNQSISYTNKRYIWDALSSPEMAQINKKDEDAVKKISSFEAQTEIIYLETKLEIIKQLLGQDVITKIESYETENILKSGII